MKNKLLWVFLLGIQKTKRLKFKNTTEKSLRLSLKFLLLQFSKTSIQGVEAKYVFKQIYYKSIYEFLSYPLAKFFVSLISVLYFYCLLNNKKSTQKVWPKDLVYKETFRLSSRTPLHVNTVLYHTCQKQSCNYCSCK